MYSETALLLGVLTVLRMPLDKSGGGFSAHECDIEADEMAPATVGDLYVAVIPGGWRPGPRHNSAGGVWDIIYGVDVLVIKRTGAVPRDRNRELVIGSDYLGNLASLNHDVDRVFHAIDFDLGYTVNNTANRLITDKTGSTEGFVEPLKFKGVDKKPRIANAELFGGTGGKAGLVRGIYFDGARRISTRT